MCQNWWLDLFPRISHFDHSVIRHFDRFVIRHFKELWEWGGVVGQVVYVPLLLIW